MELNEYDNIIRHLVATMAHFANISIDLREFNRQQLVLMTELRDLNREQREISRRLLRLLENITGHPSNGGT